MQIVVIEDDPIYVEFLKKSLSKNPDYKITAFINAEDAFAALNDALPDALIIDYNLPGMTGIAFYDKIKHKVKPDNKVIILSALDDGNMVLSFIQKGVRDYVIKDENAIDSLVAILEGKEDDLYLFS